MLQGQGNVYYCSETGVPIAPCRLGRERLLNASFVEGCVYIVGTDKVTRLPNAYYKEGVCRI